MGAPKGNQYAVGHGRPPIHTDPKEVDTLIADYFDWIEGERGVKTVKVINEEIGTTEEVEKEVWIRHPEPPTVTGLALHLGFCDKTSLYDYKDKESFSHSIKKAISRIEKHHEMAIAQGDKCTGNIFALKNFGWADNMGIDHTTKGKAIGGVDYGKLSTQALKEIADATTESE